jgi:glutathione S-transferase
LGEYDKTISTELSLHVLLQKTVIILEELKLSYEIKYLDFSTGQHKDAAFTRYNPNGRTSNF